MHLLQDNAEALGAGGGWGANCICYKIMLKPSELVELVKGGVLIASVTVYKNI